MRRGHPGMGGWRNESPRHFRPRGGGVPHYRPPQPYQLDLASKYGGPRMAGPRLHRGVPHFYSHSGPRHDRYSYRPHINPPRLADRDDRDHNYPPPHLRQKDSDHVSPYKNILTYCESRAINDHSSVNNMGDVDHRHNFNMPETFSQPPPWPNPIEIRRTSFDNRPHNRATQYHDNIDGNQVPSFTAHRPPSSDHYGSNIPTAIDNSNSFSRSVDDTVDIVRRRLLNRSESQSNSDNPPAEQNPDDKPDAAPIATNYQDEPQTSPAKKRTQRIKLNVQSNCDKIKNKIVHEIFKMDKGKMHKLMDNPNSSTKFEYAINSLITESQNSYDRHMRSVAEKSLCSSSVEFMQDDNNTIYEDTFLKQMQCILEPQDTVLLEDIKPFVMAELNKVLQLDEFDQRFDMVEEDPNYYQPEEPTSATKYSNEYHYEDFSKVSPMPHYPEDDNVYYQEQQTSQSSFTSMETPGSPEQFHLDPEPQLFERRVPRKSTDFNQFSQFKRESTESREQARQSADRERHKLSEERRLCDSPVPIFDSNVEQLSDEEDPFADLDKQYHVAVDPNFIEAELDKQLMSATENSPCETESITKVQLLDSVKDKPPVVKKEVLLSPEIAPKDIKKEIDSQILSIAKSPLKLSSSLNRVKSNRRIAHTPNISVKNDTNHVFNPNKNNNASTENLNHEMNSDNNQDQNEIKDAQRESKKLENSNTAKSTISSNARKRSIDQKPSHRKEKRKKSETIPVEPNKQILNKNIIINVNDCSSKSNEKKCDAAKSIFNLYFPKDDGEKELPKDVKNVELNDKGYSDKYVKRKETPKKKEQEPKRSRSLSTSHSNISPKDNNNSCSETQPKAELKIKLKSIDMFLETQKKISSSHQSHKNTAQPTTSTTKKAEEKKPLLISKCKIKRHVATQIIPKTHAKDTQTVFPKISKLCQTETKKTVVKATQTSPVTFEKSGIKSADTFERMKEIDLEIQVLLQEKFKLYNSLEAKQSSSNPMQNLGMTVVDVTQISESKEDLENEDVLSEDAIVDEFTSIPVEELEQIALESVAEEPSEPPKAQKRNQRQKVADRTRVKSRSPTVVRSNRKSNAPNISLIEQIITDDRPLEDIISLDDLEVPEVKQTHSKKKTKSRSQKASKKKTSKKSKTVKPVNPAAIALGIRECFVALKRVDMSRYRNTITAAEPPKQEPVELSVVEEPIIAKTEVPEITDVGVETVVTEPDIPFDMLDVSEDIVIGDECEIKSEEKDSAERVDLPINEDIILDNSQSSEDVAPAEAGQSDKECKLFDYSADEALKRDSVTVTGHADAVLAIECVENNFLAACLDGNVYHFNNDGQLLTTLRGSNLAVTCLTIVKEKYGTTVYTGSLDSRIRYYDLEKGLEKGPECNVLSPIQTMDRAWDTVFVGTRTGFVLQFECKNNMLIPVSTVKFSEQSILALRALKEGPRKVLLVAARSENVTIKDAQTGLLLRTLEGPKMTVYTLLYEDGKVYCGTSSHQIHVFDYASGSHWTSHSGGKGCVCLRAVGGLLLAGCYDGCVYIYREGDGRPYAVLRGPSLMLLSLAVQGTKIIAGYKDRSLYIWKIPLSILKEMIL